MLKERLKFLIGSLIKLPGTFLHEMMHLIGVILSIIIDSIFNLFRSIFLFPQKRVTQLISFSIIPDFKTGVLGSVSYSNASKLQSIIINIFPIFLWALIPVVFFLFGYLEFADNRLGVIFKYSQFSLQDILVIYITMQLLQGGVLSRADLRNIFDGIFSFEFLLYFSIFIAVVFFKEEVFEYSQIIADKLIEEAKKILPN